MISKWVVSLEIELGNIEMGGWLYNLLFMLGYYENEREVVNNYIGIICVFGGCFR